MVPEKVTLHGGPKHGDTLMLKDRTTMHLVFASMDTHRDNTARLREGWYTRVHDVSGRQTDTFEWVGYTDIQTLENEE